MGSHYLATKRMLVVGLGVTGQAVLKAISTLAQEHQPEHISTFDAHHPDATFSSATQIEPGDFDLAVVSPGFAPHTDILVSLAQHNVAIISEIELAWQLRVNSTATGAPAPWVGVTGTNGKTTTVGMVESILKADGRNAVAVGNVGHPVIDVALDPSVDAIAIELSSFQLHYTHTMALHASAVLNLAPDHIDWHGSFENYAAAKGKIFDRTTIGCIYNVADPKTRTLVENADVAEGARAIGFTLGSPQRSEFGLIEDFLVDRAFHAHATDPQRHNHAAEIAQLKDLQHLAGEGHPIPPHIVANALAASALARAIGVTAQSVRDGLRAYQPGGHRIAEVARAVKEHHKDDPAVIFVDDSKATNAHAALASLSSFADHTVVWIAGGLAKGARFDDLVQQAQTKLRAVVVIGHDQEPMRAALSQLDESVPVHFIDPDGEGTVKRGGAEVMSDAVRVAYDNAHPGDVVLMAPACASMDQFASYADRGNAFTHAARDIAQGALER